MPADGVESESATLLSCCKLPKNYTVIISSVIACHIALHFNLSYTLDYVMFIISHVLLSYCADIETYNYITGQISINTLTFTLYLCQPVSSIATYSSVNVLIQPLHPI